MNQTVFIAPKGVTIIDRQGGVLLIDGDDHAGQQMAQEAGYERLEDHDPRCGDALRRAWSHLHTQENTK
jgi:hypothetical protein